MARRFVDISVALKGGIASDPPHMLPEIEYHDHQMTAPRLAQEFGISRIAGRILIHPIIFSAV